MKKLIIIGAMALAMSGCQTKDGGTLVGDAQRIAVQICSFMPIAETVLSIFSTGSSALDTASEIATAICQAVSAPRSAGQPPMVAGVVVQGNRVVK